MKNKKQNLNYPLIAIVVFSSILIIYVVKSNTPQNKSYVDRYAPSQSVGSNNETKIYRSKDLKISISLPTKFKIEDRFFRITLSDTEGNIYIEKSGTNFENVDGYLDDLDTKNNSVTLNKEKIFINNLPAIKGIVGDKRYYFIYADKGTIFTIFADSTSLFGDLDKIAQSFKYAP